ncbi:hypothetical protein LUZ60_016410 [Juncus effusus]|nr:hypothetical protein LUZ60_016410 [Juncus effusus]
MDSVYMLNRFHHDRYQLLEFLLSSGSVRSSSGAPVDLAVIDLDSVSPDYVLECIVSGSDFDPSEATRRYYEELKYPVMASSSRGEPAFFLSSSEPSSSPPVRSVPAVGLREVPKNTEISEENFDDKSRNNNINDISESENEIEKPQEMNCADAVSVSLGLPEFTTGLSDLDLQETAYEALLACLLPTLSLTIRTNTPISEEKKKEKKSSFLKNLRAKKEIKKEKISSSSEPEISYPDILDLFRAQMEISEAMDEVIKQGLRSFLQKRTNQQIDIPFISIVLLNSISKLNFPTERSRVQFTRRHANILEEFLLSSPNTDSNVGKSISILLSKLRNSEEWVVNSGEAHVEILTIIQKYASKISSMPKKYNLEKETYYWTNNYSFNLRIYAKLLSSIFDVLEEGQLLEEAEEILDLIKITWPILGITEKLHDSLKIWVFFEKFIETGEILLLKHAIHETQSFLPKNNIEGLEKEYINSLICSVQEGKNIKKNLSIIDTVLLKISTWCFYQLKDYHLNFNQDKYAIFKDVVELMLLCGAQYSDNEETQVIAFEAESTPEMKLLHVFVESSIQAAYTRVAKISENLAGSDNHRLVILANEIKLIAEKEFSKFSPILNSHYNPAGRLSLILLHFFYGKSLKPFLEEITQLNENVKAVLAASNNLELCLADKLYSLYGDDINSFMNQYLHPYQISELSGPLILQWVQIQHEKLLEWTNRALDLEDWAPVSSHKRQAKSVVDIFRIVDETIEQFFNSKLPMDTIHLRFLLIGISRCLETYLLHVSDQQVEKNVLYPNKPILTRYSDSINHFIKKRHVETRSLDDKMVIKLKSLTVSKLCVKLNTLRFIRDQLDSLEDSIKDSWNLLQSGLRFSDYFSCISKGQKFKLKSTNENSQSIDELFTIFDDVRRTSIDISDQIFDFIGVRVVFWDLRISFLSSLYRNSVDQARLEIFIPQIDQVLDQICDLIVDELRDQVVSSIFRASMEGYIWILLDGGPSRVFSEKDVELMQEDLIVLKDLFIANGHGLPPDFVETESKLTVQILDLYSHKTETIIDMLTNASEQINGNNSNSNPTNDVQTLLRILCHKKDKNASHFLKLHYELPRSSEYDDLPEKDLVAKSPYLSDIFKRSASFDWRKTSQGSFKAVKKRFQEVSEMRSIPW